MTVESHSGYRFAQRPMAVWWQGQRWEVTAVVREWRSIGITPEAGPAQGTEHGIEEHFRVRLGQGAPAILVELIYQHLDDTWWLRVI